MTELVKRKPVYVDGTKYYLTISNGIRIGSFEATLVYKGKRRVSIFRNSESLRDHLENWIVSSHKEINRLDKNEIEAIRAINDWDGIIEY